MGESISFETQNKSPLKFCMKLYYRAKKIMIQGNYNALEVFISLYSPASNAPVMSGGNPSGNEEKPVKSDSGCKQEKEPDQGE